MSLRSGVGHRRARGSSPSLMVAATGFEPATRQSLPSTGWLERASLRIAAAGVSPTSALPCLSVLPQVAPV